jgi:hypothetical protein
VNNAQAQASLRLLVDQGRARVYVDGTAPGVVVPPEHRKSIRLDIETNTHRAFECDAEGFRVTLSFNRVWTRVVVPWTAVLGLENAAAVGMAQVQPGLWVLAGRPQARVSAAAADVALLTQGTPEQRRKTFRMIPGGRT